MGFLGFIRRNDLTEVDLDDMMRDRLGALFMPNGLCHFMGCWTDDAERKKRATKLGCDTHDVGGHMDYTPIDSGIDMRVDSFYEISRAVLMLKIRRVNGTENI